MTRDAETDRDHATISRRNFIRVGSAALASGTMVGAAATPAAGSVRGVMFPRPPRASDRIQRYRTLGRTGWQVSDLAIGTSRLRESSIIRYAFDKGMNYIDTAEGYGNGRTERIIGDALQHVDRSKMFVNTKLRVGPNDTESTILNRARASLGRLRTDYMDAFGMHRPPTVESLDHEGFHAAVARLKAEGRVRFTCLSNHGPQGPEGDSMADVLTAAAADGRFDVMLLVYNFLNHDEADRILAACKANRVGTTAMKTAPGVLRVDPVDPEKLTETQERYVERMTRRGSTREQAIRRLESMARRRQDLYDRTRPFVERFGIQTEEQLRFGSIHWAMQNADMHSACVNMPDFETVDKVVALSGTELTPTEEGMLEASAETLSDQYCRHGCNACVETCPDGVPVSTIMRYAYYYEGQGREKEAMERYARLAGANGSACANCPAPCTGACPFGVDVQPQMLQAHTLLTLA
jgi:predicted aldo/keto reductase-like oxidoreductase